MLSKFSIWHSKITVYRPRDYKGGSIFLTNFRHSIIALCRRESSLVSAFEMGSAMPITFLDLMVALFWPLVLSAATWAIAIHALAERDQISKVVETLTRPNGVKEKRKA